MSGYNLPDDWSSYFSICSICHSAYHESGTIECFCDDCLSCGKLFFNDSGDGQNGLCDDCFEDQEAE